MSDIPPGTGTLTAEVLSTDYSSRSFSPRGARRGAPRMRGDVSVSRPREHMQVKRETSSAHQGLYASGKPPHLCDQQSLQPAPSTSHICVLHSNSTAQTPINTGFWNTVASGRPTLRLSPPLSWSPLAGSLCRLVVLAASSHERSWTARLTLHHLPALLLVDIGGPLTRSTYGRPFVTIHTLTATPLASSPRGRPIQRLEK